MNQVLSKISATPTLANVLPNAGQKGSRGGGDAGSGGGGLQMIANVFVTHPLNQPATALKRLHKALYGKVVSTPATAQRNNGQSNAQDSCAPVCAR